MSQQFYKNRTNNHLVWVMVDATDFATPESAMSAATKIKIYGKLRGGTGTNFISSGAGSLTNDITHVGASATGIYTIARVKADLSDASAAWYDTYIINLSATGAAYQTLVVDGGIDNSSVSALVSDIYSMLVAASDVQSDIFALLSDHDSNFQSRVPKLVATNSQVSDLASDLRSVLVVISGVQSDIYSMLVAASDVQSDIFALLSDHDSNFQSRVPKLVASNSQVSDLASDLRSVLVVMSGVQSDIYSQLVAASDVQSDIFALLSDHDSNMQSRVPKLVASNSQVSDLASDLKSLVTTIPITKLTQQAAAVLALVVGVGSTTTAVVLSTVEGAAPSATNDFYNGRVIVFTSGALSGQATSISDYDGATTTATVVAVTGAPANAVTAVIA